MKCLVIIPAYNEQDNIVRVIENLKNNYPQYDYVIITGREAALCWASLPKPCPASSVRAREGAGCGSVGAVSGA